jgi:hypothetical protein
VHGFWFAAMIGMLVVAGVAAQLGWQLPEKAEVKRIFRMDRPRSGQLPTHQPSSTVVAEPRQGRSATSQ